MPRKSLSRLLEYQQRQILRDFEKFQQSKPDMIETFLRRMSDEAQDALYVSAASNEAIAYYLLHYNICYEASSLDVLDYAIHECDFLPAVLKKTELLLSDQLDETAFSEHKEYLSGYGYFHLGPGVFAYARLCHKQGEHEKALKLCLVANQLGGVTGLTLPAMITSLAAIVPQERLLDIHASAANLAIQILKAYRAEKFQPDMEAMVVAAPTA